MRVLITGSEGQVGRALVSSIATAIPYSRARLDITDLSAITRVLQQEKPDIVVNTAAFTAVDRAEQECEAAMVVNRDGAGYLALACEAANIPLIHFSTDYVFDGLSSRPYTEDDLPAPCNVYGQSKWEGEEAVRRFCRDHIILRVSSVFSAVGQNFVKTILRLATTREVLRVVDDQYVCPTSASAIVDAVIALIAKKSFAHTFHYSSTEALSFYAYACAIIEIARAYQPLRVERIEPVTSEAYAAPAKRPLYSVLDCRKYDAHIDEPRASWRADLQKTIEQLSHVTLPTS